MQHSQERIAEENRRFFNKVYGWMFLGLLLSGFTAYVVASNENYYKLILLNKLIFYSLLIFEVILVFTLAALVKKLSATQAIVLFLFYAFTTGLTLSVIFLVFTVSSIAMVFVITAVMFGIMSAYGYFTNKDLTTMGAVLIMGLLGIVIASIVNIFLRSGPFDFILSIIWVLIFTGLTAYDTQKIRKHNIIGNEGTEEDTKESIMGALTLYLDYVNLFLKLLRLLGKRR